MTVAGDVPARQQWVTDFCTVQAGGEGLILPENIEAAQKSFLDLAKNDRLLLLHDLEPKSRARLLRSLDAPDRDATIFGGDPLLMLDVQLHDVGPEFNYDWSRFRGDGFDKYNIQGLNIMSRRSYELQGADGDNPERVGECCASFAEAGFYIRYYGREDPSKHFNSTQAFIASKDDFAILCFRGSCFSPFNIDDFFADALVIRRPGYYGKVHSGFAAALEEIWADLVADLHKLAQQGTRYLHITGHSLGASLSYLAARRAVDDLPEIKIASVVNFAAARTFDRQAAKSYSTVLGDVTWRVVNNTDIVTMIPPRALGFRHPDCHIAYIDSDGLLRMDPTRSQIAADRNVNNWDESRFLKSLKSTKKPSLAWIDPVRMHSPLAYLQPVYINRELVPLDSEEVLELIDKYLSFSTRSIHVEAAAQLFIPLSEADRTTVLKKLPKVYARALLRWLTESHIVIAARHYLIATRRPESDEQEIVKILAAIRQQLARRVIKRVFSIFGSED